MHKYLEPIDWNFFYSVITKYCTPFLTNLFGKQFYFYFASAFWGKIKTNKKREPFFFSLGKNLQQTCMYRYKMAITIRRGVHYLVIILYTPVWSEIVNQNKFHGNNIIFDLLNKFDLKQL